ncbi:MAG TPA: TetR/AcrR family transcriptional regulator [Acidimicrobiia bacterium]
MATRPGLRERKKQAAMRRIQEKALDLFDQHGFGNVTIEEVADAADVSPSSVYRYFGTKEQLVLWDELDVAFLDAVGDELSSEPPVQAVRNALAGAMARFYEREEALAQRKTRYALEEPALRPALLEATEDFTRQVAEGLRRTTDPPMDDFEAEVTAAALVWAMMAASRHWHRTGYRTPIRDELERALDIVERGI